MSPGKDHPFTNRLIHQKSPYLLQHAHNPVDWFPWGEEAFRLAKDLDKPIFLSIGYATCHWCHVMERESFEDPQIAQLLNEAFVNIKVDREELPEVDSLYMEFAQGMMSGAAGWPLNVILTPELQPFFAATYLPPHNKHGLIGLAELINRIKEVWSGEEKESVIAQAAQVVELFSENVHLQGNEIPSRDMLEDIADLLFRMADPIYGGMKGTPKFPMGYQYNFLLHYALLFDDRRAVFLTERSLDMMHRGGIYDHLGGGFSRYSTDEKWLIPHFEKMLYDNAFLSFAYLEAWQLTKIPLLKEVVVEILNYTLREMTHPEGGHYSAEDAETEDKEGLYYTWTPAEIYAVLDKEDAKLFCEFYDVTEEGNFQGRSVLHMPIALEEFAKERKLDEKTLSAQLLTLRMKLLESRNSRKHPLKDDKILSSWNGLMIHSMINAGRAFKNESYVRAAKKAAKFIHTNMWENYQLFRRWRDNEMLYHAGLDEYAFLIRGLISLFEADCGVEWLQWAMQMSEIVKAKFKSPDGAFFSTDGEDNSIILRKCQFADGAEPSGNAIHCENLLRLYQITLQNDYLIQATDILKASKKYIDSYGPGYCYELINLNRFYDKLAPLIVVALNEENEYYDEIMELLYKEFLPHKSIIWYHAGDSKLMELLPFIEEQKPINNKTTLYICYEGICKKPLIDLEQMEQAILHLSKHENK